MIEEIEIWKDVVGYEGLYQVSSFGNIRSTKRKGSKGGLLHPTIGLNNYLVLNLTKHGKQKLFTVHVIVAMAFHGHKPNGYKIVVDHIDNNPLNNRADNIKLVTNRENASKDKKCGTSKFVGVSFNKNNNEWKAEIYYNNRSIHLGCFKLDIDASNAYQKARLEAEQGLDLNVIYPKWKNKSSQYKWVYWCKTKNKWIAEYKSKRIGAFNTELEAYEAVQNYIKNL